MQYTGVLQSICDQLCLLYLLDVYCFNCVSCLDCEAAQVERKHFILFYSTLRVTRTHDKHLAIAVQPRALLEATDQVCASCITHNTR